MGDERADHRRAEPDQVAGGGRGREHLRHPGRRDPPGVRPADGLHRSGTSWSATSRAPATPPQGYAAATGRVGVCMATSRPGRDQPGHADRRRATWTRSRSSPSPARSAPPRSAPTPSRRPTSAASRCRSPSTTSWSPTPTEIPRTIAEAFYIASTGRPGPVLVDVAKSALQAMTTFAWPTELNLPGYRPVTRPHAKQIREAARLILESRRPVLYVGGGVIRAGASTRAAGARRAHRHAGRHHADGPRRVPRQPPAAPRHARHARHRRRGRRRCSAAT